MKTLASAPLPAGGRLLARLKRIAWCAFLGAAPAGLIGLVLDRLFWKVLMAHLSFWYGTEHLLGAVTAYGIYTLNFLPMALIARGFDLVFHPGEIDKVESVDHLVWIYTRQMPQWQPIIFWAIFGAFLGVLILSWSKHPLKRFLKISAVLAFSAAFIGSLFLISEISWFKGKPAVAMPPSGLVKPSAKVPQGYELREISPGEEGRKEGQKPQAMPAQRDLSWGFEYRGEVLLTFKEADAEYRLIYNYPFINNDPAESFEYYSDEKICPWVYSLWTRKKREHTWELLGPFLPCIGLEDFPVLDLGEGAARTKKGTLQWVVLERDRKKKYDDYFPAHMRQPKKGGRAWSCSLPLALYARDSDNDGLTDMEEAALLTDPFRDDTDGDGVIDGQDSSPHGWFKSKTGAAGLERCVLEYIYRAQKYHMDRYRPSLFVLRYDELPPHLDFLDYRAMTLNSNEEGIFRNLNGTGKDHVICSMDVSKPKTLLFGLLGLIGYWNNKGQNAGIGFIAFCIRTAHEWRPFHFYMYAQS